MAYSGISSLRESRCGAEHAQTDDECRAYGMDRRVVQAHWLTPPDSNACSFYARCRQESMCRAIETVLGSAAAAAIGGENGGFFWSGSSWVGAQIPLKRPPLSKRPGPL